MSSHPTLSSFWPTTSAIMPWACTGARTFRHLISIRSRERARFTQAYVSAPHCSPTRGGLMTGRYEFNAHRTPHFLDQGRDPKKQGLPLTEPTLADRMRAAEYATGIVGKWRLGSEDIRFHPLRRGFQELYGFLEGGHSTCRRTTATATRADAMADAGDGSRSGASLRLFQLDRRDRLSVANVEPCPSNGGRRPCQVLQRLEAAVHL